MTKMPSWLLKILPMWDHICPSCRKEVNKNSRSCPHCRERYSVPVRVPPKVLKDKKALEEYVHEKIFPKISKAQREYLTQFFTVIFGDGFESGDFTAWTTGVDASGALHNISTTNPHHGTYCEKITPNGNGSAAWAEYDFAPTVGPLYARTYFLLPADMANETMINGIILMCMNSGSIWTNYNNAALYRDAGGVYHWRIDICGIGSFDGAAYSLALNTWYCVEYRAEVGVAATCALWVNGVEQVTTTVDDSAYNHLNSMLVGGYDDSGVGTVWYEDCVVLADAYIGPELPLAHLTRYVTKNVGAVF